MTVNMNLRFLMTILAGVVMMVLFAFTTSAFCMESFQYEQEAQCLNDLGLYWGTSVGVFEPDLGSPLNRETGVVMLLRLFGLEEESEGLENADQILLRFSDADSIAPWARNAVAYGVQNNLVVGLPDGTLGAKQALNGKAYCTLILRQLGYHPNYDQAPTELGEKKGLTAEQAMQFNTKDLTKDDLVGISYGALRAVNPEGRSVIVNLLESGAVDREVAAENGLAATSPEPPAPAPSTSHHSHHSPADTQQPIPAIIQMENNTVTVRFDEPIVNIITGNGALNLENYQLMNEQGDFVEYAKVVAETITYTEYLVIFDSLVNGDNGAFTVRITGVSDRSGNIMEDYSLDLEIIPFAIKAFR